MDRKAMGRARKAAQKGEKKAKDAAIKEEKEAAGWAVGAKDTSKEEDKERKRLEKLANKREREHLYHEESGLLDGTGNSANQSHKENSDEEEKKSLSYRQFEDHLLLILKETYPSLRHSQLKQMAFKKWQKAPENPKNQAMPE